MKKLLVAIVILVVVGAGTILIINNDSSTDMSMNTAGDTNQSQPNMDELANLTTGAQAHLEGAVINATREALDESEVDVSITDNSYDPTVLRIKKGTTVTWTNDGNVRHNVVSTSDSPNQGLNSELLASGESYSYTFNEVGSYYYFCEPHPNQMRAIVEVVE